ncbi:Uncharacterised protein [uncultured archaeon]|nr:Uncharacterised protein [uncultured archaeon]
MNNSFIYFVGLLAIMTATSLIIVASQEYNNVTLNNNTLNNVALNNKSMNFSAMNKTVVNTTNETAFRIGNVVEGNRSAFRIGSPIKQEKDAGKLWYIIQATPHGTV